MTGRIRNTVGLFLGPLLFLVVLVLPAQLPGPAHRLAAVFALVIVFWVTEAIPLAATALLGPALTIPLGIADPKAAFASFGHPIIFLFLGSFLIASAMREHGLDRRIALFTLSRGWVGERPGRILFAFGAIAAVLSMWMSNTATTAMMLPIGLGVLSTLAPRGAADAAQPWPYATGLMLMIAYASNVGGLATPVGSPPNLIAIGMLADRAGRTLTFLDWMSFGLPISIALFLIVYLTIRRRFGTAGLDFAGASVTIRRERAELGPMRSGEKVALTAFLVAVTLWIVPGLAGLVLGRDHAVAAGLRRALPEAASAILAATLLFLLPVDWKARRFALTWKQAARIDWGTILLFGGGLSLGSLAFATGLAEALGRGIVRVVGDQPLWIVVLLALFLANVMTEFMSNTATANLLVPMFIVIGGAASHNPTLTAIGATLGCSLAFCFPVATPPNAIVYGSGMVPMTSMIRVGVLLNLCCGLGAWLLLLALG